MKKLNNVLSMMLITVLFAMACQPIKETNNSTLDGTEWHLIFIRKSGPIPNGDINITFQDGKVNGNGGCNSYFGTYELKGNKIIFSQLAMTEMACMETEGIMDQEQEYLAFLSEVGSFSIKNDQLILKKEGQDQLTFEKNKEN